MKESEKNKEYIAGNLWMTKDKVIGVGNFNLHSRYSTAKFSIEQLKKAIKICEELDGDDMDIAIANDSPLIFGKLKKEKGKREIAGVAIANRIDVEA